MLFQVGLLSVSQGPPVPQSRRDGQARAENREVDTVHEVYLASASTIAQQEAVRSDVE